MATATESDQESEIGPDDPDSIDLDRDATDESETESPELFDSTVQDIILSIADSYRHMRIPLQRYLLLALLPSFVFAVVTPVVSLVLGLPLIYAAPLSLFAILSFVVVVIYPKLLRDRKRKQIRERFHLFLTHITILSMSNIDRVEVFRRLAQVDEYGALAEEMGEVVALVDTWNQSLDDACQLRSKRVPSDLLADFLERLAYTVSAGQDVGDFLINEQDSIVRQYVIRYENDLAKIGVMKELYLSMMLSTTFILVFATVIPMLMDLNPGLLMGAVIGLFLLVQGAFLFIVNAVSPQDPVWFISDEADSPVRETWPHIIVGIVGTLVMIGAAYLVWSGSTPLAADILPVSIWMGVCASPMIIPGVAMTVQERGIKDRDSGFPSFIRALGGVESVKQSSTASVLETLRQKDFGELTENIDGLYKRLNSRVNSVRAWRIFAIENGSYLIQKFGSMYVIGRRLGGDPKKLGVIISTNFNEVVRVREKRAQETSTFIGVVYGITAAAFFSAFISLEIAGQMLEITTELQSTSARTSSILKTGSYDISLINYLMLVVVLINATLSSLMIRLIDRRHPISGLAHYVILVWIGVLVAVLTDYVAQALL